MQLGKGQNGAELAFVNTPSLFSRAFEPLFMLPLVPPPLLLLLLLVVVGLAPSALEELLQHHLKQGYRQWRTNRWCVTTANGK